MSVILCHTNDYTVNPGTLQSPFATRRTYSLEHNPTYPLAISTSAGRPSSGIELRRKHVKVPQFGWYERCMPLILPLHIIHNPSGVNTTSTQMCLPDRRLDHCRYSHSSRCIRNLDTLLIMYMIFVITFESTLPRNDLRVTCL
jgi:hypothetical protein